MFPPTPTAPTPPGLAVLPYAPLRSHGPHGVMRPDRALERYGGQREGRHREAAGLFQAGVAHSEGLMGRHAHFSMH